MQSHEVEVVTDAAKAAVILAPLRREILELLRAPDSAAGLARRLDQPRQRLNHHLRTLEDAGMVHFVDERRRGNCLERRFQATARSYLISPEALGALAPEDRPSQERYSWARLVTLAGRMLRDLATLRRRADRGGKHLATVSLETTIRVATPRRLAALSEALTEHLAGLAAEFHDETAPNGRDYKVVLGAYPALRDATPDTDSSGDDHEPS